MKNQKTISKARPIRKKKKKTRAKNQTHHSNTHQKKSKNKVARAVGLGGRLDQTQADQTHGVSTHGRPLVPPTHGQPPVPPTRMVSSSFFRSGLHFSSSWLRGLHFSSSFSSFSFLSSYNQVVWFYFDNVFHVEVADDEWLAQKVFFVQPDI
jgi:hypothetical protein